MFKEYAMYKANREMLETQWALKDEFKRQRENKMRQEMLEYKQKIQKRLEELRDDEIKEASKRAEKEAEDKNKNLIDRLKKDIEDRQKELERQAEESKLKDIEIEDLEKYKQVYDGDFGEWIYNYVNKSEVKFDQDFRLVLDDLSEKKQQDIITMRC